MLPPGENGAPRCRGQALAGAVQPTRSSVASKVDRATCKERQTAASQASPSSVAVSCSTCSGSIAGGRSPRRTCRFAAASPATMRAGALVRRDPRDHSRSCGHDPEDGGDLKVGNRGLRGRPPRCENTASFDTACAAVSKRGGRGGDARRDQGAASASHGRPTPTPKRPWRGSTPPAVRAGRCATMSTPVPARSRTPAGESSRACGSKGRSDATGIRSRSEETRSRQPSNSFLARSDDIADS